MDDSGKATRINLFDFRTRPMRAFHMAWFSFFLCFFAWFGIAPLMLIVRKELALTPTQVANTMIASVGITILARLLIGWLCDRIGPRIAYTVLLTLGSLPVMAIGLADSYETFLLARLGIGVIGASFVITQYHTSVMFAPNCVGTANATSAGWGNLGGGVTQIVMPLVLAAFVGLGFSTSASWRLSMLAAGIVCFLAGVAYFFLTTDTPHGNLAELRARGMAPAARSSSGGGLGAAMRDRRVWALFFIYAACFGIELTINNGAALYYADVFGLGIATAGLVAGLFGLMNIFARTLGGYVSDRFVGRHGLGGRVRWLFIAVLCEGLALVAFSQANVLALAIPVMIVFSLFVQMSEGATYSVVPFINRKALGSVSGIVGAGGNLGAVSAGFLFRTETSAYAGVLLLLGVLVCAFSFAALLVRFSPAEEKVAREEYEAAMAARERDARARRAARPQRPRLAAVVQRVRPADLLRIYLGVALMIKGVYFVTNMNDIEQRLAGPLPDWQTFVSWCVVFAHVVGGIMLALGFFTRLAALGNAVVLLGAVGMHLFGEGGPRDLLGTNEGFQLAAFVLFTLLLVAWRGSGPLSVDAVLGRASPDVEAA